MNKITVLFFASNPQDTARLSLDEEVRGIDRRLRASKYRDSIVLKTWWAVQPDDLLQALNEERPHIVHFSGHGNHRSGLALHDELGNTQLVSGEALKKLFCALKGNIRVVVLNACYTHEQAKAIVDCVDCVIGMSDAISETAARKFAASFYRAVAFGNSVKNAFDQGVASLAVETLGQENFPTLLVGKGVKPERVVLIKARDHVNTSKQVLSEEELQRIAKDVPNKRMQRDYGDHFLRNSLPSLVTKIRYKEDLSIIMLDIDELTIINKQYGKRVGNNVIAAIARIIFIEAGTEYSGRCGDDTYYVMLPGLALRKAEEMAVHLSKCIENHPWESLASSLRVTCTFGVSQLQKREPVRDWVVRAAVAVTIAKKRGGIIEEIPTTEPQKKAEVVRYRYELPRWRVASAPLYLATNQSRELGDYYS